MISRIKGNDERRVFGFMLVDFVYRESTQKSYKKTERPFTDKPKISIRKC
jgi:hypothetical protein